VSWYQKGKTNLDFTEARDSEWQWHQLDHMQDCTSLQTDKHASTPPLSFLQAGCPSCRPTNSVKALKAQALKAQVDIHTDKNRYSNAWSNFHANRRSDHDDKEMWHLHKHTHIYIHTYKHLIMHTTLKHKA